MSTGPDRDSSTATADTLDAYARGVVDRFLERLDPSGELGSQELVLSDPAFAEELSRTLGEGAPGAAAGEADPVDATRRVRADLEVGGAEGEALDHAAASTRGLHGGERYVVLQQVGEGGMARVVKARDTKLDRVVAIKYLRPARNVDARARERLLAEARAIARLNHRHIVQVYDVLDDDDGARIVMEFVEGGDLHELLKSRGTLPVGRVIRLGVALCEALSVAHQQGIIHRDVKPRNVLLASGLTPKLADFGLARSPTATDGTATSGVMGTPLYMAPEQFRTDAAIDHRVDIYSLGLTLYQMATGNLPPGVREADIPTVLREIITTATAARPEQRYASAEALKRALQEADAQLAHQAAAGHCPACDGRVPAGSALCPACGLALELLFVACPACGRRTRVDDGACDGCSENLGEAADTALATIDAFRRTAHGEWRAALVKLRPLAGRASFPGSGKKLLAELEAKSRQLETVRADARAWTERAKVVEALDTWRDVLALDPNDDEARLALADLTEAARRQQTFDLIQATRRAVDERRFATADENLRRLRELAAGEPRLGELAAHVARTKQEHAKELAKQGASLFKQKKHFASIGVFEQSLELTRDPALIQYLRTAIKLAQQYELLHRTDACLKRHDLAGAAAALRPLSQSDCPRSLVSAVAERRHRLERFQVRRRLRRTATIGAAALAIVLAIVALRRGPLLKIEEWNAERLEKKDQFHRVAKNVRELLARAAKARTAAAHHETTAKARALLAQAPSRFNVAPLEAEVLSEETRGKQHDESNVAFARLEQTLAGANVGQALRAYHDFSLTHSRLEGGMAAGRAHDLRRRELHERSEGNQREFGPSTLEPERLLVQPNAARASIERLLRDRDDWSSVRAAFQDNAAASDHLHQFADQQVRWFEDNVEALICRAVRELWSALENARGAGSHDMVLARAAEIRPLLQCGIPMKECTGGTDEDELARRESEAIEALLAAEQRR